MAGLIPPEDLEVGPWPPRAVGGQQVGLTMCGVRLEHLPSGIVAICGTARSQHVNRTIAMDMILAALTNTWFR